MGSGGTPLYKPNARRDEATKGLHPLLRPEKLAWACTSPIRITNHRKKLVALDIPVPEALRSTKGLTKQEKRRILQARENMAAFGDYLSEKKEQLERDLARKVTKNMEEMYEIRQKLPEMREVAATSPDPDPVQLATLDGPREGDPRKDADPLPGDHTVEYEILPSFVEFSEDLSPTCWALIGPAGGGKSVAAIMKLLAHCSLHKDGARYVIIRNTYRMLYDTTMPTFFQWVPRELGKWDSSNEKFVLGGKYEFLFRSCERPEDIDKFKGLEITGYFLNEGMEIKEDIKNILDQRIGRYPMEEYRDDDGIKRRRGTSKTLSIIDSNPPDMEHWLYERFVRNPLKDHRLVLQPPYENAHNLPVGYYDKMRDRYRDAPDLINRYIEGKWGSVYRGKAVYPEFDSRVHVASEPLKFTPGLPLFCGLDFGLTPACVWTQVRKNGTWVVLSEMWADNVAADEFGDAIVRYTQTFFLGASEILWYGDPSGFKKSETDAKSVGDILAKKGIGLIPGAITVTARLEAVRRRLRLRSGLLVSPTCSRLIDGFSGSYCYKEISTTTIQGMKIYSDKPDKNKYSHIHDALQYVATGLFTLEDRRREDAMLEKIVYQPISSRVGW